MDHLDAKLLRELQRDSGRAVAELARIVGLSPSACHRRVKLLEEAGVIQGYRARLDPGRLGLALEVFVEISLTSQSQDVLGAFEAAVLRFDEIRECHLTSGTADYHLRVVARDMGHFDDIHRNCLARLPHVRSIETTFALRSIKTGAGYPVTV